MEAIHNEVAHYKRMRQYSQFKTKQELNERLEAIYVTLTEKQRRVLDVMAKHAVKYLGVCTLLNKTIAELAGTTTRSVQRFTSKLQALGYGFKVENMRPINGGNAANYFVFNSTNLCACVVPSVVPQVSPRQQDAKPTATRDEAEKNEGETNPFKTITKTKDLKELKERSAGARDESIKQGINQQEKTNKQPEELDHTYAASDVPSVFIDAVKVRDRSANGVNFAWGKVKLAFKKSYLAKDHLLETVLEDTELLDELIKRTKSAVRADKLGEVRKDFGGLMYGTMLEMFNDYEAELSAADRRAAIASGNTLFYDWLNEDEDIEVTEDPTAVANVAAWFMGA